MVASKGDFDDGWPDYGIAAAGTVPGNWFATQRVGEKGKAYVLPTLNAKRKGGERLTQAADARF